MARPIVRLGTVSGADSASGYGGISINGNTTAITAIGATFVQITGSGGAFTVWDTNDDSNSATTPDHTEGHITVVDAGTYMILGSFSFSGSSSTTFEIQAQKNNGGTAMTNVHLERRIGTGGDIGSTNFAGIHTFAAGDTLEAWVQVPSGGSNSFTLRDGNLSLHKLADA